MSASANYVVEENNAEGQIWTTAGVFVNNFSLTNFYKAPSGAGCYLTDPQIYFDNETQRWFSSILSVTCGALNNQSPNAASQIYLGVSQTNNPNGSWFEYVIPNPLTANLSDQPFLGLSSHVVVLSTNQFPDQALAVSAYTGAYFWVLNKTALERHGCIHPGGLLCSVTYQTYGPYPNMASIHPAHSYDEAAAEYMASAGAYTGAKNGTTTLSFFAVDGTPPHATVSMTNLTILRTTGPPPGVEPSRNNTVNTDDSRISTGVYQHGISWWGATDGCTLAGSSTPHACLRLIEVTTLHGYVVQRDFDYNTGHGQDDYYPGLTLDPKGDLAVTYAYSSATVYPSMAITARLVGSAGGLESPTTVAVGMDTEQGGRYGDFCDASPSYDNPQVAWLACEYILNYGTYTWNTHINALKFN
jgi:hypothetical protein